MSEASTMTLPISTWRRRAALIAAVSAAICALGGVFDVPQLVRAGLFAVVFWTMLTVGALGLAMLHHLSHGRWGALTARTFEATFSTWPLLIVLFVPIAAFGHLVYPWAGPDGHHLLPGNKALWLNLEAYQIRASVYAVLWVVMAFVVRRWSRQRDVEPSGKFGRRLSRFSSGGLVVLILTASFAAIDWVMSLEPQWYSTIYGAIVFMGGALAALAFAILVVASLSSYAPIRDVATPDIWNDLGNMLLAFVMLWTYFSLSQFLIIWSGDLPHETTWYAARLSGGWQFVALVLVLFHFVLPFAWLLSRDVKRDPAKLAKVAAYILCVRLVDWCWTVIPAFSPSTLMSNWLCLPAWLAVGGAWGFVFCGSLARYPLVPLHDPGLSDEMMRLENPGDFEESVGRTLRPEKKA